MATVLGTLCSAFRVPASCGAQQAHSSTNAPCPSPSPSFPSYNYRWWFELQGNVGGPSVLFPGASTVYPKHIALGTFTGNSAHSNGRAGLRTYPSGYRPKVNGGYSLDQAKSGPNAVSAVRPYRVVRSQGIASTYYSKTCMVASYCIVVQLESGMWRASGWPYCTVVV